jgi:hypothetical protein
MADDGEAKEGQVLTESTVEARERIYQQQAAFRKAQEEASRRVIDGVGPDALGPGIAECRCGAKFPVEAYVPGKCPGCGRRYGWAETPCMDWY